MTGAGRPFDRELREELQRIARGEAYDEQAMPDLDARLPSGFRVIRPNAQAQSHVPGHTAAADHAQGRNAAMERTYREYGYTQTDIARTLDLHYATVSRLAKAVEDEMSKGKR